VAEVARKSTNGYDSIGERAGTRVMEANNLVTYQELEEGMGLWVGLVELPLDPG
jgi:hypothetical protein